MQTKQQNTDAATNLPPLWLSVLPIVALLASLVGLLITDGADAINAYSPVALLSASALSLLLARTKGHLHRPNLKRGLRVSATQILPAVPLLALIGLVSTTWMLGGIVPVLIDAGLKVLNPTLFLALTCAICAAVSVLTGSSWTTIATVGVAFMGIGTVMGYSEGWIAGAIISGAYFGDKVSPLSDTTVVASSSCGVDLFRHIRYMLITTLPAMTIALAVFAAVGLCSSASTFHPDGTLADALHRTFNMTPLVLIVPAITAILIICRVRTVITLAISAVMGLIAMLVLQPQIVADISVLHTLWSDTTLSTGSASLDSLSATSGLMGMVPTIMLVLSAMLFGSAMIGTGMLASITAALTRRLRRRATIVGATVGSGLFLNACTADQYLSIIIGANMYGNLYRRSGLEDRLLSRSLEDSISVTSVLIPWNSCGVTQSAVLGVSTLVYMPYCIFNYLSPLMTLLIALTGFRIRRTATAATPVTA